MGGSAEHVAAHGDEDHGFGDVDALFVIADKPPSPGHPAKAALDHPASGQGLEAFLDI